VSATLPRGAVGLGLRPPIVRDLLERDGSVDYVEIIAENFLGDAELPASWLERVASRYPVVVHSVGLDLLGSDPLDENLLDGIARLADRLDAPFVSDHLAWCRLGRRHHHDLLPTPFRADLLDYAAERARYVQRRLDRPFALENLSSYVRFESSTMTEWDFTTGVVRESGCHHLLDLNNVFVSAMNHGFAPEDYLRAVDPARVLQIHLAGHEVLPNGGRIDTHDHRVEPRVWELYARWIAGRDTPTLLEWDQDLPPFDTLLAEVALARSHRAALSRAQADPQHRTGR
jgi:uncharacterized protein (UPF0276 family)